MKELLGFFINHVFVRVFQYDFGPPKHALELRDYVKYMFSPCIFTLHLMILMILMASTATSKYGPKIYIAHWTTRGEGSPDY